MRTCIKNNNKKKFGTKTTLWTLQATNSRNFTSKATASTTTSQIQGLASLMLLPPSTLLTFTRAIYTVRINIDYTTLQHYLEKGLQYEIRWSLV